MRIATLLPYKENFSNNNTGAVSISVNDTNQLSKFRNSIKVYGSTTHKSIYKNYVNIKLNKKFLQSTSKIYVNNFLKIINVENIDIIEIHNRPIYVKLLPKSDTKKILYFHNDPLSINGSKTINERLDLLKICSFVVFNS